MFLPERIDHVEVFVRDFEESIRWYKRVLGLSVVHRWDPEPIMIGIEGTKLALFQAGSGSQASAEDRHAGNPHWHRVAWLTDAEGFQRAQQHLKDCGVHFRGPVEHGIAESIYFQDPDGNPLEITYYRSNAT